MDRQRVRRQVKIQVCYFFFTLLAPGVLLFCARYLPGFAEGYARNVYPLLPHTLGRLVSLLPFSLMEVLLLVLAVAAIFSVIVIPCQLINPRRRRRLCRRLPRLTLHLCCLLSTIFFCYVLNCGINYHRDTFGVASGLLPIGADLADDLAADDSAADDSAADDSAADDSAAKGGPAELENLYRLLCAQAQAVAEQLERAEDGRLVLPRQELQEKSRSAMVALSRHDEGLITYYPQPKPIYFSRAMSRLQLAGIFSSYTMEANYNQEMPETAVPFTACHELAHVSGFAREDEANFIAYLGCLYSEDPAFIYSGTYYALGYVLNGLAQVLDAGAYQEAYQQLPQEMQQDFARSKAYWQLYQGRTSDAYHEVNDRFLKANGQEDGMASYDRMVDWLLAYYRQLDLLDAYALPPEPPEPVLPEVRLTEDQLYSSHVLLLDRQTGTVLFAKKSNSPAQPASVTKILTAIVAIEQIEDLEETVVMTRQDFTGLYEAGASLSGFAVGEEVRYLDLLYTLMLVSGCDSANALANNLCSDPVDFVKLMNDKVAELGLSGSRFTNPTGLTDEDQYTTPEDMAVIFSYALDNPLFREIISCQQYKIPPTNVETEGREIFSYYYYRILNDCGGAQLDNGALMLGGKTGYTKAAGLCLAALAEVAEREYLALIFGGPGTNRTEQFNFLDAMTLFAAL